MNTTNDCISENNTVQSLDDENKAFNLILITPFLSNPGGLIFLFLLGFIIWKSFRRSLLNNK